jgi:predicted GNAT family N-acyltransferase
MDHEHVRVRLARPEDVSLLGPIDTSANPLFAQWGHPEFEGHDYDSIPADVALKAIADGRLLALDHLASGELIGWVVMFDRANGDTSIGQISVHIDYMGRGYGGVLLTAAIDRCRREKRASIVLNTQTDVPWNRPWYEKFGFVVMPEAQWDNDMRETVVEQTEGGLDWSTRVHMRLNL